MSMRELIFILADSSLETIPGEMLSNAKFRKVLKKRGKKPSDVLLDSSIHWRFMFCLDDWRKRGRPDIVHVTLILLQDSLLNACGHLEVYVHVYDGRVFHVKPETRIPKHFDRFKGLMAQLLIRERVPPTGEPLIYKVADSLREFVEKHGKLVLLWERGEPSTPERVAREALETGRPVGIGMFPRGDFKKSTLRKAARKYSLFGGRPLKAWTVASHLVHAAERILGVLERAAACTMEGGGERG